MSTASAPSIELSTPVSPEAATLGQAARVPARVLAVLGGTLVELSLPNGKHVRLNPHALFLEDQHGLRAYRGEPFGDVGIHTGALLEVVEQKTGGFVGIVRVETEPSLWSRIKGVLQQNVF